MTYGPIGSNMVVLCNMLNISYQLVIDKRPRTKYLTITLWLKGRVYDYMWHYRAYNR